jgi:hypothetical protein
LFGLAHPRRYWLAGDASLLLEEVDAVNAEGLFGLPHLPILTRPAAFQLLAELPHLVHVQR